MTKGFLYVKTCCGMCKKRITCGNYRMLTTKQAIDSTRLKSMANCPLWDPEKKEKEGEK